MANPNFIQFMSAIIIWREYVTRRIYSAVNIPVKITERRLKTHDYHRKMTLRILLLIVYVIFQIFYCFFVI